jgi:uncharacterized membrane protein YedE/YeeE
VSTVAIDRVIERSTQRAEIAPAAAPYMNPYLAGVGLGLVLLAAFVVMGRGLGASGAFSSVLAWIVQGIAPEHAAAIAPYSDYLGDDHPLLAWLVFLVAGAFAGALVSGLLGRRVRVGVDRGPRSGVGARLLGAYCGGVLAGIGAKLALGCTSGQALSGGALLNVGSWIFMLMVFAGGYGLAWFVRKQWI